MGGSAGRRYWGRWLPGIGAVVFCIVKYLGDSLSLDETSIFHLSHNITKNQLLVNYPVAGQTSYLLIFILFVFLK